MENEAQLLPLVQPPRRDQEPNDPQVERTTAFGKEAMGITGCAIIAGVSGYKDIAKDVISLLSEAAGLSLLITFVSSVVLMHFQMHQRSWWIDMSAAVLVSLTSALLMLTNTMFVALMDKDDTVLVILALPVVLVLAMVAGADDSPPGELAQSVAEQDNAYEEAMKGNAELATFGVTAAFAIEAAVILGYLKYGAPPAGCVDGHAQIVLAVSYFASTVSVLAMTVTALPVRALFPAARARLVAVVGHLKCAMLAALISMAMILAVEFLEWWFMLSLVPEAIAVALEIGFLAWKGEGTAAVAGPAVADVGGEEAARRERTAKGFRTVATISFTLMAGTYAVYLGHHKYDVYLRAAMLVMLAAIVSSLRRILRPFEMDHPRARGWWAVAVGAVSLLFPGIALVIAVPLVVKVFLHFYFETR